MRNLELAELAIRRKIKLSNWIWNSAELHLQSPQTSFTSSSVCSRRASICHQKDAPAPVLSDLALSATKARITSKAHLIASFQQTQVTHPQTTRFRENKCQRQCKLLLKVSSCPREHAAAQTSLLSRTIQVVPAFCVSKYSRTSPGVEKLI